MNKIKIVLIASVCCLLDSRQVAAEEVISQDSKGNYIIDSADKLTQFAINVNNGNDYNGKTIILTDDIKLSTVKYPETNHTPIGIFGHPFLGTFDGQGHKITNLQVLSDQYVAGLFGYIGTEGVVKDVTIIQAGKPYIIRWNEAIAEDLSNPVFLGVKVEDKSKDECAVTTNDGNVTFQGIFDAFPITEETKSILYLGAANKLYYPDVAMTIGSCHAYFIIHGPSEARSFILNFNDSEATSIRNTSLTKRQKADTWFSLTGSQLNSMPVKSGVYIRNGRKIVVK